MDSFRASVSVRVTSYVDPVDAFHGVTRVLEDASRGADGPLKVTRVWAQADDKSTTLARDTLQAAADELATMGLGFDYAFQSLEGAPRESVAVFVWKDQRRVMVDLSGPDRVRVEGLRSAAQKYLHSLAAESPSTRDVAIASAPPAGPERLPWWKRPTVWLVTALGTTVVGVATAGVVRLLGWN